MAWIFIIYTYLKAFQNHFALGLLRYLKWFLLACLCILTAKLLSNLYSQWFTCIIETSHFSKPLIPLMAILMFLNNHRLRLGAVVDFGMHCSMVSVNCLSHLCHASSMFIIVSSDCQSALLIVEYVRSKSTQEYCHMDLCFLYCRGGFEPPAEISYCDQSC